jgi:hypothetical protein
MRSSLLPRLLGPAEPLIGWMTERFISHHHHRLISDSHPIEAGLRNQFQGFFSAEVLAETRLIRATIPNPKFYPLVRSVGIQGLLDMSSIQAITLLDLVAYRERVNQSTLFHELVHVVQYRVLGLHQFARLYVRGFLKGGGYDGIPLEKQAYELEARFSQNPKQVFSVEQDVVKRRETGRL